MRGRVGERRGGGWIAYDGKRSVPILTEHHEDQLHPYVKRGCVAVVIRDWNHLIIIIKTENKKQKQ